MLPPPPPPPSSTSSYPSPNRRISPLKPHPLHTTHSLILPYLPTSLYSQSSPYSTLFTHHPIISSLAILCLLPVFYPSSHLPNLPITTSTPTSLTSLSSLSSTSPPTSSTSSASLYPFSRRCCCVFHSGQLDFGIVCRRVSEEQVYQG